MKKALILLAFSLSITYAAAAGYHLGMLQGAWWSSAQNPTADFAILGEEVWLDHDAAYHPCRVDGDVLSFDLGAEAGAVRHRIVSLEGDRLVLEDLKNRQRWVLMREAD